SLSSSSPLSLHDALPIYLLTNADRDCERGETIFIRYDDLTDRCRAGRIAAGYSAAGNSQYQQAYGDKSNGQPAETRNCHIFNPRSEEHTSELQSPYDLVC